MEWFKRKKPTPEVSKPIIIKMPIIKPTKCRICLTVYQAKPEHLEPERNLGPYLATYKLFSACPVCRTHNEVELEEVDEKVDERCCGNCKHTDKGYKDEPCCDCMVFGEIYNKWEPADE